MDKTKIITFEKWYKGQAKHPIYGLGLVQNVEVFENKGIAKLKGGTTSFLSPSALILSELYDIHGNQYLLSGYSGAGTFYKNAAAIQTGITSAWDMAIYKDYVWIRSAGNLSAYGPISSGAPQFFANLVTGFDSNSYGKLLVGQDDFLYSGNGNFVAKINVTAGGVPGVPPTIITTLNALDLPDGQYVTTLCEYGKNIMIGTCGSSSFSSRGNFAVARIYPWNRQAGTLGNPGLADLPIVFSENGVNAMEQHANKLYVQAGTQGNVYITDSTNYEKIAELPYTQNAVVSSCAVFPNAICISARGTLQIGVSTTGNGFSKGGLYEIDISDPAFPVAYRTISTGSQGLNSVLNIGVLKQGNFQTINIGWSDGATFGFDGPSFTTVGNFGGVIETEMIKVGGFNSKRTFEHIEWCLAEPLIAGQSIRISYRLNNKSAYAPIKTWSFGAVGSKISFEDVASIADAEYVQLKIELDYSALINLGTNIFLIAVKIW